MNYGAMPTALAEYLLRLDRSLWTLPRDRRDDILRQVSEHLGEDLYRAGLDGALGYHWLIMEHGAPEAMGVRFCREEWKDRILSWTGGLLPVLAGLGWTLTLGTILGLESSQPGYIFFAADFPFLLLAVALLRSLWRRRPGREQLLYSALTGLLAGLLYCSQVCHGHSFGLLEHGLYGAFFGIVLNRHANLPSLPRGMGDVAIFFLLMQMTYMGRMESVEMMSLGCLLYHTLNGFGMTLALWAAARLHSSVCRMERMLAPSL